MAKRIVKKGTPKITKILGLTALGIGAYLLFTKKARAGEITEEFIPDERPQDQLDQQFQQLPPSTIIERATEEANIKIQQATEEANIKIQQVQQEVAETIEDIRKRADEELAALKRQMESAYQLRQEDLIQEYRQRDEIVRAEAEEKIRAAQQEAARLVEAARIEAEQKVQAARLEAYISKKTELQRALSDKEYELDRILAEINRQESQRNYACETRYYMITRQYFTGKITSWGADVTAQVLAEKQRMLNAGWLPNQVETWLTRTYGAKIRDPQVCDDSKYKLGTLLSDKNRKLAEIDDLKSRLRELG